MSPASTNAVFSGSCTALVTPFKNGQIDKDAFCKLVDWQIENGTAALIPVGTTRESPTLSHEEHDLVVDLCFTQAAGPVPVIAGAGLHRAAGAVRYAPARREESRYRARVPPGAGVSSREGAGPRDPRRRGHPTPIFLLRSSPRVSP